MPLNTLKDALPPQTARRLKNTGRQDKLSQRDRCSASGIDFRDPRNLQRALNSYFAGTSQKTFRARVQASILNAETVTSTLNRHQARDLVDYDPDCGVLLLKKWGRPVHGSAMSWFDLFVSKCREVGFLSAIQRSMITFSATGFPLPGKLDLGGRKSEARVKYPDYALVFIDPEYHLPRPAIILEVGFTESYSDLLIDMQHWLIKSDEINIVILISVEEDTRTRDEVRRATDFDSPQSSTCSVTRPGKIETQMTTSQTRQHIDRYSTTISDRRTGWGNSVYIWRFGREVFMDRKSVVDE